MNFSLIRLNPSQELRLVNEVRNFCGKERQKNGDGRTGRLIELKPLAAVLPPLAGRDAGNADSAVRENAAHYIAAACKWAKEDFLKIDGFDIYGITAANIGAAQGAADTNIAAKNTADIEATVGIFYFPCRINISGISAAAAIPCALSYSESLLDGGFSLEKIFSAFAAFCAQENNGTEPENVFFSPTSFCLVEAEIERASWKFYEIAWKKLKPSCARAH